MNEQKLTDYKAEYKNHLENNFLGTENNAVKRSSIDRVDYQLANVMSKPEMSLQLRQEAIAEMKMFDSRANNKDFKNYLDDKSDMLAHGIRHFDKDQQKELLQEDMKFENYQLSDKKQENNKEVEELER
ncbi:hypothetical protein [Bacillus pseudomycoides]|uniref:hypothetical protein n=1 Tax=Bacillus pseudomycoides TaxID=64104 RepID=UPI000BEBC19F|nr:hypothetical protein [Bacillus pseudomycoides]PEB42275.1 hypothetical protein COO06_08165 [Bacillus pseudomycoides]